MLAIKGYYKDGHIELLEPFPEDIQETELSIIIIPKENREGTHISADSFRTTQDEGEIKFKILGFGEFIDTASNRDIDWEEYFGIKK